MRKRILALFLAGCMSGALLTGCGGSDSANQDAQGNKDVYFEIVEEINNGDYDAAEADIKEQYGSVEYSLSSEGVNKMNINRLFYDKQEKYEEEMNVLLEYLQAFDFKSVLETEEVSEDKENVKFAVKQINEISEKVSDETRNKAVEIVGQDILDSYK